ncbi:hypothetical protein LOAG_14389 [Loa loa]|uniref:Uncharacterized protein n=1 Tax=Loa loa TaxID=7209 RepID=A0A1S0TIB8_LOALO|nr:hypothetical protein LOAG_14389 [Loa loa]EFO14133.2 hypothetical protein LOAG_14389 [Loa loa]
MFSFIFSTILSIAGTDAQVAVQTGSSFNNNFIGNNSLNNNANAIQRFSVELRDRREDQTTTQAPQTTSNPLLQLLEQFFRGFSQRSMSSAGFPSLSQYGYYYPYGTYGGYWPYSYYYYYYYYG